MLSSSDGRPPTTLAMGSPSTTTTSSPTCASGTTTCLAALEDSEGWVTTRTRRPVLIPGSLDGVETGIRQLLRLRPLEWRRSSLPDGDVSACRRSPEITRVNAWLVLRRNATRDHLDLVALADRLGVERTTLVRLEIDGY
jgi:hypothetical protein